MSPSTLQGCGTRASYVRGCRCLRCRGANAADAVRRAKLTAYGRATTDLVDADPVRDHVNRLRTAGLGRRRIATLAGVSSGAVWKLLYGDPPTQRLRPDTAAKLLGVPLDPADGALVPAVGARRRLQALIVIGWPQAQLAAALGMAPGNFNRLLHDDGPLLGGTVRAIQAAYAERWNATPPQQTPARRGAITRARRYGAARGWAPPQAWDDDIIDDPAAVPDLGGDVARSPGRPRVDLDEVEHLERSGAHITEIARRMRCSVSAIEQARLRRARVAS